MQATRFNSPTLRFTRHYLEMVVAMLIGMLVLGLPLSTLIHAPALELLNMAVTMTVPMVAWMRYHGHGRQPVWEMSAAMLVPTFVAIGLLWAGTVADEHAAMAIQHAAMFPLMLVAMLLRRSEYV